MGVNPRCYPTGVPIVSLPVPAGVGFGAQVDVSALGKDKTVIVGAAALFRGLLWVETSLDGEIFAPLRSFDRPDFLQDEVVSRWMRVRSDGRFAGTGVTVHVGAESATNQFVEIPLPDEGNGLGDAVDVGDLGSFMTFQTKMLELGEPEIGTLTILARGGGTGGYVPINTFKRGGYFNMRGFTADSVRAYGRGFAGPSSLIGYTLNVGARDD